MVSELIQIQKSNIEELKLKLQTIYTLNLQIDNLRLQIEEEVDQAGKKKFGNELKRREELTKRSNSLGKDLLKEQNDLKIEIDILNRKIDLTYQEINYFLTQEKK